MIDMGLLLAMLEEMGYLDELHKDKEKEIPTKDKPELKSDQKEDDEEQ
jgi:hypothetical protein